MSILCCQKAEVYKICSNIFENGFDPPSLSETGLLQSLILQTLTKLEISEEEETKCI